MWESAVVMIMMVLFLFGPFAINQRLAKSRGKSVALMLLLTLFFSWLVTLILACMSPVKSEM